MPPSHAAGKAALDRRSRRSRVEADLQALGPSIAIRRTPPPEGRLGPGEDVGVRLRKVLLRLGPTFATFGRYLASRVDLLPRRTRDELASIPDTGEPLSFASVTTLVGSQLGSPLSRLFFEFHETPFAVGTWSQRHLAWLAPGVPAMVTIVRPDAHDEIDENVALLPLLAPWLGVPDTLLRDAADDFVISLRRRLDQLHMASSLTTLAADARGGGGLGAPVCYRDHCSTNVLTVERLDGLTLDEQVGAGETLARRVAAAWLRQAFSGSVVPYDFTARDFLLSDDRLLLGGGSFEPQPSVEHSRFLAYLSAVVADDPDSAASWILEGAARSLAVEVKLRHMLRQAVPFREGEWSGDDRLAEHVLVQWRVARNAGCPVSAHRQRLYRGLQSLVRVTNALAPEADALLGALEDERMRIGLTQAEHLLDPRYAARSLDRAVQQLVDLPQKLDDVLARAAEGRLRMNLDVPEAEETEHVRNRTVLLVTALVGFAAVASLMRQLVPAFGGGVEKVGALILLVAGGWLLYAAARL